MTFEVALVATVPPNAFAALLALGIDDGRDGLELERESLRKPCRVIPTRLGRRPAASSIP